MFISTQAIAEIRDVAWRPKAIAKLKLDSARVERFLEVLIATASMVNDVPELFALSRDPEDAHYVNLAIAAQASLIVSRDRDLLDLMTQETIESDQLRRLAANLRIVNPVAFLRENKLE